MILALALFAAQVPLTPGKVVNLSWPAVNCGSATCGYYVSRLTVTAGTKKCPISTGSNYTPLNFMNPAMEPSFIDATARGLTVCYVVQTEIGGTPSKASLPAVPPPPASPGPFVVPQ